MKLLTPQDVTEPAGEETTSKPKPMPKPKPAQQKRGLKPLTPQDVPEPVRYAKGGVTRADGCCKKGHTKGRMV
jgi:hypothetical protein